MQAIRGFRVSVALRCIGEWKLGETPQLRTSIVPIVQEFSRRHGNMPRFLERDWCQNSFSGASLGSRNTPRDRQLEAEC